MTRITTEQLDALEAAAKDASTGPWKATDNFDGSDWLIVSCGNSADDGKDWSVTTDSVRASMLVGDPSTDARFIALARNLAPTLVAEVRRLRADLESIAHNAHGFGSDWDATPEEMLTKAQASVMRLKQMAREALEGGAR